MRLLALVLASLPLTLAAARADDVTACLARHAEVTRQAEHFTGEPMMKRLLQADLQRARKEAAEGDADECMEALDHAAKLIAGDV